MLAIMYARPGCNKIRSKASNSRLPWDQETKKAKRGNKGILKTKQKVVVLNQIHGEKIKFLAHTK